MDKCYAIAKSVVIICFSSLRCGDYCNNLQIQEVQQILKVSMDDKLTVLEAMYQAGFNSKSSFNTAFKKETG
jgi:AraC-like DNA-binding protein